MFYVLTWVLQTCRGINIAMETHMYYGWAIRDTWNLRIIYENSFRLDIPMEIHWIASYVSQYFCSTHARDRHCFIVTWHIVANWGEIGDLRTDSDVEGITRGSKSLSNPGGQKASRAYIWTYHIWNINIIQLTLLSECYKRTFVARFAPPESGKRVLIGFTRFYAAARHLIHSTTD